MKGHLPIRPNNHLFNDGVPSLRRKRDLHLFQLPVKSFQSFPLFSPRAFLLLDLSRKVQSGNTQSLELDEI